MSIPKILAAAKAAHPEERARVIADLTHLWPAYGIRVSVELIHEMLDTAFTSGVLATMSAAELEAAATR